MSPATLRLILLVSCAHALVHVYELAFPSVEQLIAASFHVDATVTGLLGTCWRLPFGFGALAAGWLADRFGSKPMLIIYLAGCAVTSALVAIAPDLAMLFVVMFAMGSFASIYHPAGLAIISHETRPQDLPMALGYHGIFGSIGIAGAPFLAALVLGTGADWRQYYLVLTVPGALLAMLIAWRLKEHHRLAAASGASGSVHVHERALWGSFAALIVVGTLNGFVYAALLNFLPRFLGDAGLRPTSIPPAAWRNYLTGGVLLLGCIGQYAAGRIARPGQIERLLVIVLLGSAPPMFWMAVATGPARIVAAGWFTIVHFMHQPIYNSLVAHYVPRRRRSLGFGTSNLMAFGFGSLGAGFAGYVQTRWGQAANYSSLGTLILVATLPAVGLWLHRRHKG